MLYDDITRLLDSARLTIHRAVAAVEMIHGDSPVTVPMRAVLEFARREGPHTVSAIARARSVSRQHIQVLVNDLLDLDLVERLDNPDHQRAPLITLTTAGTSMIDAMHARERDVLEPLTSGRTGVTPQRVQQAADVLEAVGAAMAEHDAAS